MAKVLDFPKKTGPKPDAQVTYLQSYLRSNIIKLTEIRTKLLKLQDDLVRLKRGQLKLVQNADDNGRKG